MVKKSSRNGKDSLSLSGFVKTRIDGQIILSLYNPTNLHIITRLLSYIITRNRSLNVQYVTPDPI